MRTVLRLLTTIDDFNDSVLGDPITYARCEQFPGSESPLSLPVYAWPSGSAYLLDQTLLQTVLASGTSSQLEEGTSAVAPPMDLGVSRLLETGLPGCPYRFSESGGLPFSNWNPAYGLQLHHPRFLEFVEAPESARLLDCSPTFWVDRLAKGNKRWQLPSTCSGMRASGCPIFRYCHSSLRRCTGCRSK